MWGVIFPRRHLTSNLEFEIQANSAAWAEPLFRGNDNQAIRRSFR